jgi:5-aminolevulinate synthase
MSNLQTIARRCPVMGKALAVQTAKSGKVGLGGVAALRAIRAFSGQVNSGKAKLHTSRSCEARAVDDGLFVREKGALINMFRSFMC